MSELAGARFQQLVGIMRTLRSEHGCAWDRQQTVKSLRPYVLGETYEVLDALDREDYEDLEGELGDFLLEAVFVAQICEEEGRFSIADSIAAIAAKLIRRHPHVFHPDGTPLGPGRENAPNAREVKERWEEIKAKERSDAGRNEKTVLSGIPRSAPSLLRAYELSARAATVGFDWVKAEDVLDKIDEEVAEIRGAIAAKGPRSPEAEEEVGDLLFAIANLARKMGVEPEAALRVANDKFQRRFDEMERRIVASERSLQALTLDEYEAEWQLAKATTKDTKNTKDTKDTKKTIS